MKHGSLFSGIGGFDLAAEWMGWENVFHCEWNKYGSEILKQHWPEAISYEDITKTDFTIHRGRIDILTGGFPCQPFSTAGLQLGTEDERHLWPEMLRAIREIAPRWVVGENVRGLLSWNGGMVFDQVQIDLETEGYEVLPFLLPACGVNAPHRRDRIWFVAFNAKFTTNGGHHTRESSGNGLEVVWHILDQKGWNESSNNTESSSGNVAHTTNTRIESMRESSVGANGFAHASNSYEFNGDISRFRTGEISQQQTSGIRIDPASDTDNNGQQRKSWWSGDRLKRWILQREFKKGIELVRGSKVVTNTTSEGCKKWKFTGGWKDDAKNRTGLESESQRLSSSTFTSNTCSSKLQGCKFNGSIEKEREIKRKSRQFSGSVCNKWEQFPTQSPICYGDDGFSSESLRQWIRNDFKRVGLEITEQQIEKIIKGVRNKWREETIKAGGNAIVPQMAHQIFKAIDQYERGSS